MARKGKKPQSHSAAVAEADNVPSSAAEVNDASVVQDDAPAEEPSTAAAAVSPMEQQELPLDQNAPVAEEEVIQSVAADALGDVEQPLPESNGADVDAEDNHPSSPVAEVEEVEIPSDPVDQSRTRSN